MSVLNFVGVIFVVESTRDSKIVLWNFRGADAYHEILYTTKFNTCTVHSYLIIYIAV